MNCFRLFGTLSVALLAAAPPALAQMNMAGHAMEMMDEIPPDQLPAPIRMTGIGNAHIPITATREAQMWFDQGLNLLHDFWDYESARAFEQGVRVDPRCAMCYWGLYKAEAFYHSTAQGFAGKALEQAVALKKHVSKRERLYIDGAAGGHSQSLRKLVARNPKDLQARIFLSQSSGQDLLPLLESVLREDPDNSAANHYYIHALEATEHPEKALRSADILARVAPAAGHMVHMPGHIYFRLGDYARAGQSFAASMAVDERYMREQQVEPDNDWNYVHNLMYAVANLMEQGRFEEATRVSAKITAGRGKLETTLYINSARDSMSRLDPQLPVALRTANASEMVKLLKAAEVDARLPNLEFLRQRLLDFATGMEDVRAGRLAEADGVSARFDAEMERMSQPRKSSKGAPGKLTVMADALLTPLMRSLSIIGLELRGSLLAARGEFEESKARFAKAAAEEKALGYREPPQYVRPVGETEGAAMLAARRWADARAAYERALRERPHSGFALYGMAQAIEQSGDRATAVKAYEEFLAAWKDADQPLPELAHARSYVAMGAK